MTTNIQMIPLDQLILSPTNVRKTGLKIGIPELAESIEATGLINNLAVKPTEDGKFEVVAGGRRLAALQLLAKRGKLEPNAEIGCNVLNGIDTTQASLTENFMRRGMHPADEFDAFKKMADDGAGVETIAAQFGVTPAVVKQRMKLAVVSPKLIAIFRKDEMTLEQLSAFTITDDHKAQLKVWNDLPDWAKERGSAREIREALTEQHAAADSKLARFVGLEVYRQAGGHVNQDLFDPEGGGWLTNVDLLERIAGEKLAEAAERVKVEGWKWVRFAPSFPYEETQKDGRVYPSYADPTADQQAEVAKLQEEADAIMAEHGEEPEDVTAYNRLVELGEQIEALSQGEPVWTGEKKAIAGVYVSIGHNGELLIQRGIVKPDDKAALRALNGAAGQGAEPDEVEAAPKPKGGIPASLVTELTSHKTVAAQLVLANNPDVALLAVTHALAVRMLYPYGGGSHSSLGVSGTMPTYPLAIRQAVDASPAGKKLAALVKAWRKKIPKEPEGLWAWLAKQKPEAVQSLLAVCAALTVDLVQSNGAPAKDSAAQLVTAIKLDMADHWEATADNYFGKVPKKHLLDELDGSLKPNSRKQLESMKREPMAKAIEAELKGKRWLPAVLKAG